MILKNADDKAAQVAELNRLMHIPTTTKVKAQVQAELRKFRSGLKGENNTSFHLDDAFKDSKNVYIMHDLRIEHNGRTAQIDHILINRFLEVFVLETKQLKDGMKINENGEFLRWDKYKNKYEGMASPLAQNARHIDVLKAVFQDKVELPTRLGFTLKPSFHSRILVNSTARIDRPEQFDTREIVKTDDFFKHYKNDGVSLLGKVGWVAKKISAEQVVYICNKLIKLHQPIVPNYAAKFGVDEKPVEKINETPKKIQQEPAAYSAHQCSKCNSHKVRIESGRYGYYFKCGECSGNTAIKVNCGLDKHQERIQKKGNKFYRVCAECETRTLYFENEA